MRRAVRRASRDSTRSVPRQRARPTAQLSSQFLPPRFVGGRVSEDVKTVRIRFADGSSTTLTPTRGYVLWAAQAEHLEPEQAAVGAVGLDATASSSTRSRSGRRKRAKKRRAGH